MRADALAALAGQHGAGADDFDARLLDLGRDLGGDVLARLDHDLLHGLALGVGGGDHDILQRHPAEDALVERLDDLVAGGQVAQAHAVDGAAVGLGDDQVVRHVDETAREVAGVGGLQGRVGQTFAAAVRGDEVLQDGQALAEVGDDGLLDDFAHAAGELLLRLGHEAAHAGQLPDLLAAAAGAGVGHEEDGVEARLAGDELLATPPSSSRRT